MTSDSIFPEQPASSTSSLLATPSRTRVIFGAARYLLRKALLISLTIVIGVYITILIVNQPARGGLSAARSPFEVGLEQQINSTIRAEFGYAGDQAAEDALRQQLRAQAGLDLPEWQRNLLWTYKALTFDWGRLTVVNASQLAMNRSSIATARDIVLEYFPNTLLLMGSGYFLVFLVGIPLALYLARHYGGRLDRSLAIFSPVSSIPSWVIAILLIALFAVELRWLPVSGMYDAHMPEQPLQYAAILIRHMILPVFAIFISLLFQLVYAWRTFFVIYAEEDFVELAKAKGLRSAVVERQYVLRPALPFVITSFSLSLIAFWQMTMALEVVFQWKGIGWLYINKALPNFWGESIYPGELIIAVGIVVIFAFLLGMVVFLLDVFYVIVDPRIRVDSADNTLRAVSSGGQGRKAKSPPNTDVLVADSPSPWHPRFFLQSLASGLADSYYAVRDGVKFLWLNLRKDPGAIFGMVVIALLFLGSAYAVFALPYEKIGRVWDYERLTGRAYVPRLAAPVWTDLFARSPRLSTLVLDEETQQTTTSASDLHADWTEKTTTFTFDYPYTQFPSEVFLYLDPTYAKAHPFVSLVWVYPDGTRLDLKGTAVEGDTAYDFESGINVVRLLALHPEWRTWYKSQPPESMPATDLLFVEPGSSQPKPVQGTYQLEVKSLLFESGSDVHSQLVLLGQVYGVAGTDYWRRNLVTPLLWGMPFTLVFGLLGATVTTVLAMLLSAAGVWLGGPVDTAIQRFTEVNMVLPVLAIGVLSSALLGISLWVILGMIVLLNVFGVPARTFRSAFLQEREAPYIEAARAYGAGNFRIITRYLMPRILPMLIPQLVILVPTFVFLEATLGLFNIRSGYPTWGRIIYEGLSKGALYGSRFWVLEPIFLLLLTGLAFALFGSALERALNPRMVSQVTVVPHAAEDQLEGAGVTQNKRFRLSPAALVVTSFVLLLLAAVWVRSRSLQPNTVIRVNTPVASAIPAALGPSEATASLAVSPGPSPTILVTNTPAETTQMTATPTATIAATVALTSTVIGTSTVLAPSATAGVPGSYVLQRGEFPYCIARRFNVDPYELLALNGLQGQQVFFRGTRLQIPQGGAGFPGNRMLQSHPASYVVSRSSETLYSVACAFGDIDPLLIAQANNLPVDSALFVGQQLQIP